MKYVIDISVVEKWFLPVADSTKALKVRWNFLKGLHGLLTPDIFPIECAAMLVKAEQKGVLPAGRTSVEFLDLQALGIETHPSAPLILRATAMAISTRIAVSASLYVALAEREQCQLLTADQKIIRNTRKHFSFVVPLSSLP